MISINIILPEKLSSNRIYRMHHHAKNRFQTAVNKEVAQSVREQKIKEITKYPVRCKYTFYVTGKTIDVVNTAGMAKAVEDGLRYAKILKEDSLKFVKEVTFLEERSDKKYSYVILEIIN